MGSCSETILHEALMFLPIVQAVTLFLQTALENSVSLSRAKDGAKSLAPDGVPLLRRSRILVSFRAQQQLSLTQTIGYAGVTPLSAHYIVGGGTQRS